LATGASTAEVAVVLVDARNGLTTQTRRHVTVAALLGIRQFAVCVNKMDLVDWSEDRFDQIFAEMLEVAEKVGIDTVTPIPISALDGDNVVDRSEQAGWYSGPTLLDYLETVDPDPVGDRTGGRVPVQLVLREAGEGRPIRRYAGMVHGGPLRPGERVAVLPSGQTSTVDEILVGDTPVEVALPGLSVTVSLTDDLDVIRGDVIAAGEPPAAAREIDATLCWFTDRPLRAGDRLLIKQGTRVERAIAREVLSRMDIEALAHEESAAELDFNDIGVVRLATAGPLVVDAYDADRVLGSFIVIDEATDRTVGAGMIRSWA
jgi:bifunctional enzyme CysN/CysC/sulfate adenylyltransferase subunit 1